MSMNDANTCDDWVPPEEYQDPTDIPPQDEDQTAFEQEEDATRYGESMWNEVDWE